MEVYYINFDLSLAYMDQISPSFDSIKNMHGKMMKLTKFYLCARLNLCLVELCNGSQSPDCSCKVRLSQFY